MIDLRKYCVNPVNLWGVGGLFVLVLENSTENRGFYLEFCGG